jgi:signal transduction histidine kinase
MLTKAQKLLVELIEPQSRAATARVLAHELGARDLIVFIEDVEVRQVLPAPGFPQTLHRGRQWHAFLAEVARAGRHVAPLTVQADEPPCAVTGIVAPDRSVLALIGGAPREADVEELVQLLPLLTRSLKSEQTSVIASGHATAARTAATQAHALAEKLSATRLELQKALATAESAARAKDDFLAVVSHELRTPLNAILGWVQLHLMGRLDAATQRRALESIERNAKSQARLIEDILDLSRIVSGRFRLNVQNVDLAAVIEAAIDVVRPAAEAKGIRLQSVIGSHAGGVSGDPDRLQQVLWNMLSNAVAHTPPGGRIFVCHKRVNSHVELSVQDSGRGIDAAFLPYVFDRFRQADNSATRGGRGLGLGLAISRHLVEMHGGTIRAASAGADQGATFTVELPLSAVKHDAKSPELPAKAAVGEVSGPHRQLASLDGLRVLVVDDEPDVRELLAAILRQSGAAVTTVKSVPEALESFAAVTPDLVLSDIEMPHEDGYSLLRKIRDGRARANPAVPAIALSAYAGPGDRMRALDAKPVEPAELVALISNLVRR